MTAPAAPQDSEITLPDLVRRTREIAKTVWLERRRIYRSIAVAVALGLLVAFVSATKYSSSTKILPYRSAISTGGLSGLAGLAGIRLPAGVGDQTITAELYPVIAQTVDFRIALAETPLRFRNEPTPVTFAQYFAEHRSAIEIARGLVSDARSALAALFTDEGAPVSAAVLGSNGEPLRSLDREYLRIIRTLDERLVVSIDKKTSVITITGVMPDAVASADLVQSASQLLMQRIIEYEAKKAREQLTFVEEQLGLSRKRYERAQRELAEFADRNRVLVGAVSQIERERLQREYDVAFEVFQQFSLEVEQARVKQNQDTPVFTVLERVSVPSLRSSPNRTAILILAVLLGAAIGVIRILWSRLIYEARAEV